ncbi:MAG: peptide ABC transporter substrate-binding protein [Inquilinaceae bacterium]
MTHMKSLLTRTALATILIAGASAAAQAEMVFHRGNAAEPETLDPHLSTGVSESYIQLDLFEGLVVPSATAEVMPGVAEEWEVSDDGLTYTFRLRDDAKWSDGTPVTANDFVYSWKRLVDPATASDYAYFLWPVKNAEKITNGEVPVEEMGVSAPDDGTFVVTLETPTPYFVGSLMHTSTWPVPQHVVEEHGNQWTRPGNIVTNGAFILTEWTPQSHLKAEKNPNFHAADEVVLDTVFYYPTEDLDAELKRFRAGELDITYDVPSQQIPWIEENMADQFRNTPYLGTYFYAFNVTAEPFQDAPELRKALSLAIDRDILTRQITQGGEIPAYGWVPPGMEGYDQQQVEWADWSQEQRAEEARRLFAEAGYGPDNPLEIELLYNTNENHKKIAIAVAAMWDQTLGDVTATLRNEEWKVYLETRDQLDFQVVRAGWIGDYKDPYTFIGYLRGDIGVQNPAGYDSDEYNQLVIQSVTETDPNARMDLMEQAEAVLLEDLPIMPIYFYTTQHMVAPHVSGWEDNIMDWHLSRYVSIDR